MIVFVVEHGSKYTGQCVVGVSKTWTGAQSIVADVIADHDREQQEFLQATLEMKDSQPHKVQVFERKEDRFECQIWETKNDQIRVSQYKLKE